MSDDSMMQWLGKAVTMFGALVGLQFLGRAVSRRLGPGASAKVSGFIGGIISSTAIVAGTSRKVREGADPHDAMIAYSAANLAMLLQAAAIVAVGVPSGSFLPYAALFFAPAAVILIHLLFVRPHAPRSTRNAIEVVEFGWRSTAKLTLFIVGLVAITRLAREWISPDSVYVITFVTSLFELHAVTIANVGQLSEGLLTHRQLGILVGMSLTATFVAKWALASFLGGKGFSRASGRWTIQMLVAVFASTWIFLHLTREA